MKKALENIKILISRSYEESKDVIGFLEMAGAKVVPFPAIKISPVDNFDRFDKEVQNLSRFEYLIFTSANACRIFSERIKEINFSPDYSNTIIVSTGSKTSDICRELGIKANIVPEEFSAAGVIKILSEMDLTEKNVFIPSSELARDELKTGLTRLGAKVIQIPIYKVSVTPVEELAVQIKSITEIKPDLFAFTSPSSFNNFLKIMNVNDPEKYFSNSSVAALGKTTEKAIKTFNVNVDLVPESFTIEALVNSIIEKYK